MVQTHSHLNSHRLTFYHMCVRLWRLGVFIVWFGLH